MPYGSGREIEWYSILYFTEGDPSFRSPAAVPHLEGGKEVRFETAVEAILAIERTPMYLRDRKKAFQKFRIVRTSGKIVYEPGVVEWKRLLLKSKDTYYLWFEVMYFEDERSFDAPFHEVHAARGVRAAYSTFNEAFDVLTGWAIPDEEKGHYNIVMFQSELLPVNR